MTRTTSRSAPAEGTRLIRFLNGLSDFDFVGRSRLWLVISTGLILLCLVAVLVQGLRFGIDFTGGTAFVVTGVETGIDAETVRDALGELGVNDALVQFGEGEAGRGLQVSTPEIDQIAGTQQRDIVDRLAELSGVSGEQIDVQAVGPRWGEQISLQALRALAVFLVLVVIYISFRFEFKMALSSVLALLHDIAVTVGLYALAGFEITPASVIAFLTILGYSLYDTVIVFDRVVEDTVRLSSVSTRTYGDVANEAINHVLVRSLSTSVTSLLPVGALLFIGAQLLGADTLEELALALFIGMGVGTYSSVFVATPFVVWLKEREPRYAELKARVEARRGTA